MSLNIQTSTGLLEIGGKVTKEKIIEALEYVPANETHTTDKTVHVTSEEKQAWNNKSDFSGVYEDLEGRPNITENDSDNVVIADRNGNIIMQVDTDGVSTTNVNTKTVRLNGKDLGERLDELEANMVSNIVEDESGKVEFTDESGNVIARIGVDGFETTKVTAKSAVIGGVDITTYVDTQVANLVNSAPDKLNTLDELAAALGDDENFATTVTNSLAEKAKQTDLDTHTSNKVVHITVDERTAWNAKSNFSGDYNDLTNAPSIQENSSGEVIYADEAGNIIAKVNANGLETTTVTAKSVVVNGTDLETALDGKAASEHTHSQYLVANDIAGKADKSYVDTELAKKSDTGHTHDQYLEASDISGKADKTYVDTEISAAIAVAESDATNKDVVVLAEAQRGIEAVQNVLDTHTHTELHSHSNKAELDKIADGKVEYWDAKSDFSGNYADLVDAPSITEDDSNNLVIADRAGNIIFRSDGAGFETTTLTAQSVVVNGTDVEEKLGEIESTANTAKTHAESDHARVDATLVEQSDTNGNIKINGVETTVYTHSTHAISDITGLETALEAKLEADDIANKVDKEDGKGLSTNDFTTEEKEKLSNIKETFYITVDENGIVDKTGKEVNEVINSKCDIVVKQKITSTVLNMTMVSYRTYEYVGWGFDETLGEIFNFSCVEKDKIYSCEITGVNANNEEAVTVTFAETQFVALTNEQIDSLFA